MTKKSPAKKAVKKVKSTKAETVPVTFKMKKENKIEFIKVANANFMDLTKRMNFLIEQDIINHKNKK